MCPVPEDDHRLLPNFSILTTNPEEMGSFLPTFSNETCFDSHSTLFDDLSPTNPYKQKLQGLGR